MPDQSPAYQNINYIANSSGNVAASATTSNLPGAANKTTYISGIAVGGLGATAATAALLSIGALAGGQALQINIGVPAGVTTPIAPVVVTFSPPLAANAPNTAITVALPSFGAGNTNASVAAWGFQS